MTASTSLGAATSAGARTDGLAADIRLHEGTFVLEVSLAVEPGTVLAVLGPNGAGKTTLLRALAGLVAIDAGRVSIGGSVLADPAAGVARPPEQRPVGMVFQDHLLFPHLSALDNVAFGLRCRGATKHDARSAARDWLTRMGLADRVDARPRQLSGGEAQRVALARAIASDPELLLLDEPMAALDAGTVAEVRRELRGYLGGFRGVTVLVTHDPLDALALASHVLILESGHVTQAGPIAEVTAMPRTRYVADLMGVNLLHGTARGTTVRLRERERGHEEATATAATAATTATASGPPGSARDSSGSHVEVAIADHADGPVHVLIRPQAVSLHARPPEGSPRNQWRETVTGFDLLGDRVRVRLAGEVTLVAEITPASLAELAITEGSEVWAAVKATEVTTYPA